MFLTTIISIDFSDSFNFSKESQNINWKNCRIFSWESTRRNCNQLAWNQIFTVCWQNEQAGSVHTWQVRSKSLNKITDCRRRKVFNMPKAQAAENLARVFSCCFITVFKSKRLKTSERTHSSWSWWIVVNFLLFFADYFQLFCCFFLSKMSKKCNFLFLVIGILYYITGKKVFTLIYMQWNVHISMISDKNKTATLCFFALQIQLRQAWPKN